MTTIDEKTTNAIKGIMAFHYHIERRHLEGLMENVKEIIQEMDHKLNKLMESHNEFLSTLLEEDVLNEEPDSTPEKLIRLLKGADPGEIWGCVDIERINQWVQEWKEIKYDKKE